MTKRSVPLLAFLVLLALSALACNFAGRALNPATPEIAAQSAQNQVTLEPLPQQPQSEVVASPTIPGEQAPVDPGQAAEATDTPGPNEDQVQGVAELTDEVDSFQRLATFDPPERDDLEVARLYGGWDGVLGETAASPDALAVGDVQSFRVLNHDAITFSTGQFVLEAISEHAYFWFSDQTPEGLLSPAVLEATGESFDQIYERNVANFGPEDSPGVDGDPRVHIVNAVPGQLCANPNACGLAGYFSGDDVIPSSVDPNSNAREMFVMNGDYFGGDFYLNVLGHELRHMIEDNYDRGDDAWESEGSAMMAEDLLGFTGNALGRANRFLDQPDQQLNAWTDGDTIPYYGMGYLLNRYIYDRLGPELYRQFAASPAAGLAAIDAVAADNGLDLTGQQIWQDWLAAMALIGRDGAPDIYRFGIDGLNSPAMTAVGRLPAEYDETVHQYAVDYYELSGDEELVVDFAGSTTVPLLDIQPASGKMMWLADRANNSHVRLTRTLDLTGLSVATLEYSVYHDIESGYDFAYLFVSTDGGQTWQPLVAEHMQGQEEDPSDSALADHFYTGRSEEWRRERVDLTPYAGQEIMIRFAYLTDMVLTFGGIALDDIAVPELGFVDDAETLDDGWTAEGFERVTGQIPQRWELQLVTFPGGSPRVEQLALNDDGTLAHPLDLAESGDQAILIVSAWAPMTLQPAAYELAFQAP